MLPLLAFAQHLGDLFGFLAGDSELAGGEVVVELIEAELGVAGFQFLQIGAEIVVENEVEGVFGVAMQVEQAGEALPGLCTIQ